MTEKTKSCNLTECEIKYLIKRHGKIILVDQDIAIERINYLNKRLKAFSEPDTVKPVEVPTPQEKVGW